MILENNKGIHLSGLNGLRAIVAIAVVLSHTVQSLQLFDLNPFIFGTDPDGTPEGLNLSDYGVSIFFVLSGFLITYLLLIERRTQPINVKYFYIRRVLRIWPIYYLYLAACIVTFFFFDKNTEWGILPFYVFFAANIANIFNYSLPHLLHYWSIAVEEQFYLFWPWVMKVGREKISYILLFLIMLFPVLKLILAFIIPGKDLSVPFMAAHFTRFHCMFLGAYGAILFLNDNRLFLRICTHKLTQFLSWCIILLAALNRFHTISILDHTFIAVVAVALIVGQATIKNRLINLETRIFDFLGKISYGIYIIHPLVIFYLSKIIGKLETENIYGYIVVLTSVLALTIFLAFVSYEFFEKRFLKKKHKYSAVISSASRSGDF
ncbi:MAG: acyltransferase family protein [Bacteroidia bacterium]